MTTSDQTADDLHHLFVDEVARVRDSTAGAPDPVNRQAQHDSASGQLKLMTSSNTSWLSTCKTMRV
jgi:hypothetical protein